ERCCLYHVRMVGPSRLELRPTAVIRTVHDGNVIRRPESHFLDFIIDGRPLSDRVPAAKGMVTMLNRPWLATVPDAVEQLCGRQPCEGLADGRVPLLVCRECGELSCGALTATLDVGLVATTWSDLSWEDGSMPSLPIEAAPSDWHFSTHDYM